MSRITNGRWVTSAFGTASSAALSGNDTVYSVTPLYHPSGLMMSDRRGGRRRRPAGHGHRASSPSTFWEEVRRYGVTVASYTWTLLHDLVEAPPQPGERHHPVRLFIGSGMPRGSVAPGRAALCPRPRARVLRLDRDRARSWSTSAMPSRARWAGRCRAAPRCGWPPTTSKPVSSCWASDGFVERCDADEVGHAPGPPRAREATATMALRGVFAARGRLAGHRRPVPPRRRRRLLAAGQRARADPRPRRDRCSRPRSATRWATCRRSIWPSPTACRPSAGATTWPWPR